MITYLTGAFPKQLNAESEWPWYKMNREICTHIRVRNKTILMETLFLWYIQKSHFLLIKYLIQNPKEVSLCSDGSRLGGCDGSGCRVFRCRRGRQGGSIGHRLVQSKTASFPVAGARIFRFQKIGSLQVLLDNTRLAVRFGTGRIIEHSSLWTQHETRGRLLIIVHVLMQKL